MVALAARSGSAEALQWLLDHGASGLLAADPTLAAIPAARVGHMAILELVLARGFNNLAGQDAACNSAIHEAACCGHTCVVEWLLAQGAEPALADGSGCTPLHLAALHGQKGAVWALLGANADPGAAHRGGATPLAMAAFNGHNQVVEVLLEVHAEVGVKDLLQMTALHQASLRGHAEVAMLLLAAGAELGGRDHRGRTPLHLAALGYDAEEMSAMPDSGFASGPDANLAVVGSLLDAKADASIEDVHGALPLMYARRASHRRVAALLEVPVGARRLDSAAPSSQ